MWIDCGIYVREWIFFVFCLWFIGYVSVYVFLSCNFLICGLRLIVLELVGLFIKMYFFRLYFRIFDLNFLEVRFGNL